MLIAPFFGKIRRFFPPVVMGTTILLIGLSLLPVAVRWAAGGAPKAPDFWITHQSAARCSIAGHGTGDVWLRPRPAA
ncbi:solute carrier family 23 protein [Undibacterium arcticum]